MAFRRPANTASPKDVAKILRSNLGSLGPEYKQVDLDKVVNSYQEFLKDLIGLTPRPTKTLLVEATQLAFNSKKDESTMFSERILSAVTHCRQKARSSTSGRKLHPAVLAVAKVFGQTAQASPGPALVVIL